MQPRRAYIPDNTKWLTQYMKELGYTTPNEGICLGIAIMGAQAILSKDLSTFDKRLSTLYMLSMQDFEINIETTNSILAFLDGIEINQYPYAHDRLFAHNKVQTQNPTISFNLTESTTIEKQGGARLANTYTGAYNQRDLSIYLSSLKDAYLASNTNSPFVIIMRSANHAISFGYNKNSNTWSLINSESLPTQYYTSINELILAIDSSFKNESRLMVTSQIYCSAENLENTVEWIREWQETESYIKTHIISDERANEYNDEGATLLMIAIKNNDTKTALSIIENGYSINDERIDDGATPLYLAAIMGSEKIVDALLAKGADPRVQCDDGTNAIDMAEQMKHEKILLKLKAAAKNLPSYANRE